MRFNTFFFDLDETLYPASSGLWKEIRARITTFMQKQLGLPLDEIEEIRERYFQEFGTTLRGLQVNHQVNMDEYLAFVHDLPLNKYIYPNPILRTALRKMPGGKFIFTNADCAHAARVIKVLGLEDIFDKCIDVHVIFPHCKPMPEAFQLALVAAGDPDPVNCVLFDDQRRITRAARDLGMHSVLVGQDNPGNDADEAITHLSKVTDVMQHWH